ncbi:MAG: TatD family hydrolase [Ruminococcus sp.]|nr:TatD family hydrolase [Ruminococcus sp.]
MNNIFDAHAHYDDKWFDENRAELLDSMENTGVCGIVNAAVNLQSTEFALKLSEKYPFIYATTGFHPENLEDMVPDYLSKMEQFLKNPKVVAIGEIGLDYHWDIPREEQKRVFEEQLAFAKDVDAPVVVHDREAHGDTMELLRKYRPKGLVHCFSGSVELMREVVSLGMSISLGGVVTFKNARRSVEVAKEIPLYRLLLETDAPYMAPEPYRGKQCNSSMIAKTAEKIAEIRGMDVQKLLDITCENARQLYGI